MKGGEAHMSIVDDPPVVQANITVQRACVLPSNRILR